MFVILFICFSFFFCYADVIVGGGRGTSVRVNDLLHINVAHCCILETMKPGVWQAADAPSL